MSQNIIRSALNGQKAYAGKAYFLQHNQYLRYDWSLDRVDDGYPLGITAWHFPSDFLQDIDGAINGKEQFAGKGYFFKGNKYIRYDWAQDRVDNGFPLDLSAWHFPPEFVSGIDGALNGGGQYAGKAYFFKGNKYIRYDWAQDRVDDGYPLELSAWNFPREFLSGVDAALNGQGQYAEKAYFFKGEQYIRYDWAHDAVDAGYPKLIAGNWRGIVIDTVKVEHKRPKGNSKVEPKRPEGSSDFGTQFSFALQSGESIRDRIVRCCTEALAEGPMGQHERHDFYRDFISCRQETSLQNAERLTGVRTSCALFVRAVRQWCGAAPTGPYRTGTGMFVSMGNVSFSHPSFVPCDGTHKPQPGDYFYIASTKQSNDGHTGIFIREIDDNEWQTAEGGGGDGTVCQLTKRTIVGTRFNNDHRQLWGWFDCTKVGLPI